jgi:hypothetical protein
MGLEGKPLQKELASRRFWARLDRSMIESTGAGIRVFVPESQTLTDDARGIWSDMVAEARKNQSFEGARWSFDITELPEGLPLTTTDS